MKFTFTVYSIELNYCRVLRRPENQELFWTGLAPGLYQKPGQSVFTFPHYLEKIRFNMLDVRPIFSNNILLSVFATKYINAFVICSKLSTHPAHLIVLNNTW